MRHLSFGFALGVFGGFLAVDNNAAAAAAFLVGVGFLLPDAFVYLKRAKS